MHSSPRTASTPTATPIAVTGVACRLPGGVESADALWELLRTGTDAVGDVPAGRWNADELAALDAEASSRPPRWVGGFLDGDVGAFDAEFFGISHEEAELMDPQHRLLLELAWEACEHAGLPTSELAGTNTGVFAGLSNPDHAAYAARLPGGGGPYLLTGNLFATAAGRISHTLGLCGPSMALDSACSSGLVAAHQACQSLQLGECDMALAGAANLLLSPRVVAAFNETGVLSPSGRCRSFDQEADGYVRAEGAVVLVLKRLDDAQREGDRVLAVLRGTAVNHDGKTSRFTLPSGQAQQDVFRAALRRAGIEPAAVGMIEAHGTGTRAGDLVELTSLTSVYGDGDGRCALGSVKTNVGHSESAAGMVGLLKAVLAVHHGEIPASLHFHRLPAEIEASTGRLFVPTATTPWPSQDEPRTAAVCSYGVGGTNAHAIVQQPPASAPQPAASDIERRRTFLLSARSTDALEATAARLADWLGGAGATASLDDVAHTLAMRRSHGEERLAVLAESRELLVSRLRDHAEGGSQRDVVGDYVRDGKAAGLVWVFGGHGSQWTGMGRDLIGRDDEACRVIDEIDALVMAEAGFSPRELLLSDVPVTRVDKVQPLIFAIQVALATALRSRGVQPAAVVGHSMGEVAAAVVAGALSLADGVKVMCRRSRVCVAQAEAQSGAMAAVELSAADVRDELEDFADVDVAVMASPRSTVIAGARSTVRGLVECWNANDVPARMLAVDIASHCSSMAPLADEVAALLDDIAPLQPAVPFYSTVLSDPRAVPAFDADYWADNMRCPVRALDATTALVEDGYRLFVEISPHPVAKYPVTATLEHLGVADPWVLPTLRRERNAGAALDGAIAALHCAGHPIDWKDRCAGGLADVPPTAWNRQHHLIDLATVAPNAIADRSPTAVTQPAQEVSERAPDIRADLHAAPSALARQALAEELVIAELRSLLRLRARRIDPAARFSDLGLDSLHAVRLRNSLQSSLGIAIALEAIWSNPSARELGAFLAGEAGDGARDGAPPAAPAPAMHARSQFVDLPAGRFHYLQWGRHGLPQAVLLHANCGSAATWTRVALALADDYEVFALDLRGHGASGPVARGSYGLRAAADDVVAFLDALGLDSPLLVGHSWGAAVALVVASGAESGAAPPALSGLVLEDPPASLSTDCEHDQLDSLLATLALSADDMRETLLVSHPDWDDSDRATMVEGWLQASGDVAASVKADGARSGTLMPLLSGVSAPTLLLRADATRGTLLPEYDWHAAKRLLGERSQAVEIAGATHEVHRSRFEDFMAAVTMFTADLTTRGAEHGPHVDHRCA
jgi:acyl transferase domain-containing protein/alpha-beta hydrolase superfamily lysophospholipase